MRLNQEQLQPEEHPELLLVDLHHLLVVELEELHLHLHQEMLDLDKTLEAQKKLQQRLLLSVEILF